MTEEKNKSLHPISELLCKVYKGLLEREEVNFPLYEIQIQNIDSVVKTVNAEYFGIVRYSTSEDKAAAYFYYIIKDHPVTDGNKRLAVLWLEVFCTVFDLKINLPENITLDALAVAVEESSFDQNDLIRILKKILFIK